MPWTDFSLLNNSPYERGLTSNYEKGLTCIGVETLVDMKNLLINEKKNISYHIEFLETAMGNTWVSYWTWGTMESKLYELGEVGTILDKFLEIFFVKKQVSDTEIIWILNMSNNRNRTSNNLLLRLLQISHSAFGCSMQAKKLQKEAGDSKALTFETMVKEAFETMQGQNREETENNLDGQYLTVGEGGLVPTGRVAPGLQDLLYKSKCWICDGDWPEGDTTTGEEPGPEPLEYLEFEIYKKLYTTYYKYLNWSGVTGEAPVTDRGALNGYACILIVCRQAMGQVRGVTCSPYPRDDTEGKNSFCLFSMNMKHFDSPKTSCGRMLKKLFYVAWAVDFVHDYSSSKREPTWNKTSQDVNVWVAWQNMFSNTKITYKDGVDLFMEFVEYKNVNKNGDVENVFIQFCLDKINGECIDVVKYCFNDSISQLPIFYINNASCEHEGSLINPYKGCGNKPKIFFKERIICTLGSILDSQSDCGGCVFDWENGDVGTSGENLNVDTQRFVEREEMEYNIDIPGLYYIYIKFKFVGKDLRIYSLNVIFHIFGEIEADYIKCVCNAANGTFQDSTDYIKPRTNYILITNTPGKDKHFVHAASVANRFKPNVWKNYYMGCVIHYFQKYIGDHLQELECFPGNNDFLKKIFEQKKGVCGKGVRMLFGLLNNDRPSMMRYRLLLLYKCLEEKKSLAKDNTLGQYQHKLKAFPTIKKTIIAGGGGDMQNQIGGDISKQEEAKYISIIYEYMAAKNIESMKIDKILDIFGNCLCDNDNSELIELIESIDLNDDGTISSQEITLAHLKYNCQLCTESQCYKVEDPDCQCRADEMLIKILNATGGGRGGSGQSRKKKNKRTKRKSRKRKTKRTRRRRKSRISRKRRKSRISRKRRKSKK